MRKRRQMFVDPRVQGAMVARVVCYWFACLTMVTLLVLDWRMLSGPTKSLNYHFEDVWYWFGPAAAFSTLILLPLLIVDTLRLSNRFAGPVYRLRREMQRFVAGEPVQTLGFRNNDFWRDLADEFNAFVQKSQQLVEQAEQKAEGTNESTEASETEASDQKPAKRGQGNRADEKVLQGSNVGNGFDDKGSLLMASRGRN